MALAQLISEVVARVEGKTEALTDTEILGSQSTSYTACFSCPSMFHDSSPCVLFTYLAQGEILHFRKALCTLDTSHYSHLLVSKLKEEAVGCWQVVSSIRQTSVLVVCSTLVLSRADELATVTQWLEQVARYYRVCMIEKSVVELFANTQGVRVSEWSGRMGPVDSVLECQLTFVDLQPSIDFLLRLRMREISPQKVRLRLLVTSENENSKSQEFRQTRNWRSALKAASKLQDGFCTLSPVHTDGQTTPTDVQLTADALCEFANSDIDKFASAVVSDLLQELAVLINVPKPKRLVLEKPVELSAYGVSQCDSSRERMELHFKATDYSPPDELKPFFLETTAVRDLWGTYLKANLAGWTKVYKSKPLDLTKAEKFAMDLYSRGLCFNAFPWRRTYCSHLSEYRLAPYFRVEDLLPEKPSEAQYRQQLQESWLSYVTKKRTVAEFVPARVFDPSAFAHQPINSPRHVLGKGGFGIVYRNLLGSEEVAIKGTNPARQYNSNQISSELEILSTTKHPNIVNLIGVTTLEDKRMIVLERCEMSLSMLIKRQNATGQEGVTEKDLTTLMKIAKALEYLHSKEICHFDVKPANILLKSLASGEYEPKLSDFGMASRRRADGTWKKPGYTIGYSSPEQLQGCKIGAHCDVWAFSMIAYFLLFRKAPFSDISAPEDKNEKKQKFLEEVCGKRRKPKLPETFERPYPNLAFLLRQCWHSDPFCRPTMSEVVRKLEKCRPLVNEIKERERRT